MRVKKKIIPGPRMSKSRIRLLHYKVFSLLPRLPSKKHLKTEATVKRKEKSPTVIVIRRMEMIAQLI